MTGTSYITISITAFVVAVAMLAGFKGCLRTESRDICGISFIQTNMDYRHSYSFYLRESDGTLLFDADLRTDSSPSSITLESIAVDSSYLQKINEILCDLEIKDYVKNYKKPVTLFNPADKATNTTTLYYNDGTDKSALTKDEHIDALYEFFFNLAKEYADKQISYEE